MTPTEQACYGRSTAAIDAEVLKASDIYSPKDLVMSILSDAQELIDLDRKEQARKTINCAKYILSFHIKELVDKSS